MLNIFSFIKKYLFIIGGAVVAVLFGLLKYEKYKNEELEKEVRNKDAELEIKDFEATQAVKEAEVRTEAKSINEDIDKLNKETKEVEKDEKIDKDNNDDDYTSVTI